MCLTPPPIRRRCGRVVRLLSPRLQAAVARIFNHKEGYLRGPEDWHKQYAVLNRAELSHIPGIYHVQARGMFIATSVDPQDVTLDGEVRGQTPGYARVADERLRVVVPA